MDRRAGRADAGLPRGAAVPGCHSAPVRGDSQGGVDVVRRVVARRLDLLRAQDAAAPSAAVSGRARRPRRHGRRARAGRPERARRVGRHHDRLVLPLARRLACRRVAVRARDRGRHRARLRRSDRRDRRRTALARQLGDGGRLAGLARGLRRVLVHLARRAGDRPGRGPGLLPGGVVSRARHGWRPAGARGPLRRGSHRGELPVMRRPTGAG